MVQCTPVTHKATAGWQICCQLKDGSASWEKLSELKESHPVQTAEFAVEQGLNHGLAFNWWVKQVLKKRDRIITSIRKWQTSHMFGIELPKTVKEALAFDAKNGNTLWANAISKEMKNVRVALKVLSYGKSVPICHQFV